MYSDKLYPFFSRYLSIFERKKAKKEKDSVGYDIIQFGYNRIGYDLVKSFKKLGSKHLIVDYDPDTILELSHKGVACRYGDADDEDFLDELQLSSAKMVISTIPKFDTNTLLINQIRRVNKNAIIIVISHSINETIELYKLGASYVIMPHFLGGNHASKMIDEFQFDSKMFRKEKEKHRRYLHRKKKLGHDKPRRHRSRHE